MLQTFRSQRRRTRSQVENARDRQIRRVVAHAYANVPFYTRLYDSHGVSPRKVRGAGDLEMLPLVTKDDYLRANHRDLIARGVDPARLRARPTTGTTGESLIVRRTTRESTILKLFRFQALRSIGVRPGDLSIGIRLPRVQPGKVHEPVTRRIANTLGFYPRRSLIAIDPMQVLNELRRLSPSIVGGLPGLLSNVAASWPADAVDEVRSASWPRIVLASGERITPPLRSHLRETFGAPVIGMYASEEFNVIGWECQAAGVYHVSDESVAVEVLHEGRAVEAGETGQLIGTALYSFAFPFIRYDLGDVVTRGETHCDCGLNYSTLSEIQGRRMNYVTFSDGAVFHDVKLEMAALSQASWVRQARITQATISRLDVRLAPLREPSEEEVDQVRSSLEEYIANRATVQVILDPDLGPKTSSTQRVTS